MSAHAPVVFAADPNVSTLLERVRQVEVWPGHILSLSRAGAAVVASPPFQRLSRLRQMGLAFHAFPNAENTRASHSLGVAYWSSAFLTALGIDAEEAGLSRALVVELFALIHDIDLMPLGHTLRYQSRLLREEPGRPRLTACIAAIRAHVARFAFRDVADGDRQALLDAFDRHLLAAAAARPGSDEPAGALAAEIVNAMLGGDLVDFALRDSQAIGRAQELPKDYPGMLCLVRHRGRDRLALPIAAADTAVDLYRARFEVFAASVNHPRKLAADAILDAVVRRIEARDTPPPRWRDDHLLLLGDDAFLDLVAEIEPELARPLLAGELHEEAYRTTDLDAFRLRADATEALALMPGWRDRAEAALHARLPWAAPGELIVAVSAEKMQAKPPDVPLVTESGEVRMLADVPGTAAAGIAAAYAGLWSLRVYVAPARVGRVDEVAHAAAAVFGPGAAPW